MSRHLLTLTLMLLAATAQGMTPAREDANGAGGSCPESQAAAVAAAAPAPAVGQAASDPAATPPPAAPAKVGGGSRAAKAGDRWHSFLPGMFK
jgi:hypothetical protein